MVNIKSKKRKIYENTGRNDSKVKIPARISKKKQPVKCRQTNNEDYQKSKVNGWPLQYKY